MSNQIVPLQQLKLAAGPESITAEQRYWRLFKNPKSHTTTASWSVTHISYPSTLGAGAGGLLASGATAKANDYFAVTAGPRVDLYSIRKRDAVKSIGRFESVARSGEIRSDGRVLVAGDDSGKMQVFDMTGGGRPVILKTWHVHRQPTWVTRWSPTSLTTLMSASDDKTVRLWDLTTNDPVHTFVGHQDYVRSGAFLPGNGGGGLGGSVSSSLGGVAGGSHMLVTGSYDATVRLWDARAPGRSVLTFKHAAPVEAVLPMPSGTVILAAADNAVSVLDIVAARPLRLITSHQKTVTSLCLASRGERVVSGGLDGHIKVYETGTWNVVASDKYPSPVLSVAVVPLGSSAAAATGADGSSGSSSSGGSDDRHLVVGMASGVLSIKTRLPGAVANRKKDRERDEAMWRAGGKVLDKYLASQDKKQKRDQLAARRDKVAMRAAEEAERQESRVADGMALEGGLETADESTHFVINPSYSATVSRLDASHVALRQQLGGRIAKEDEQWQRHLQKQHYGAALDRLLANGRRGQELKMLSLLTALRHRSALREALENRDEESVRPILRWACRYIVDPRYTATCTDVGLHLLDLYAEYAADSNTLHSGFHLLWKRVKHEVEQGQLACQTRGMVESLMLSSA